MSTRPTMLRWQSCCRTSRSTAPSIPAPQRHALDGAGRHGRHPFARGDSRGHPGVGQPGRAGLAAGPATPALRTSGRMVVEGRDIGTVIAPDADPEDLPDGRSRASGPVGVMRRTVPVRPHSTSDEVAAVAADLDRRDAHGQRTRASPHWPWRPTRWWSTPPDREWSRRSSGLLRLRGRAGHPMSFMLTWAASTTRPRRTPRRGAWTTAGGSASSFGLCCTATRSVGSTGFRPPGRCCAWPTTRPSWTVPVLFGCLPRRVSFLIKAEAVKGALGWLLTTVGQYALQRDVPDRQPLLQALAQLKAGGAIGVFPEGTRGAGMVENVFNGGGLAGRQGRRDGRADRHPWRRPTAGASAAAVPAAGARAGGRAVLGAAGRRTHRGQRGHRGDPDQARRAGRRPGRATGRREGEER